MRRGHPLERLYRDARCGSLQPATVGRLRRLARRRRARRGPGLGRLRAAMVTTRVGRGGSSHGGGVGPGEAASECSGHRRPRHGATAVGGTRTRCGRASSPATTRAAPGTGGADLRELGRAHPAGGGEPAAGGRLRLVHRARGCAATRWRRSRSARRRSAAHWPVPGVAADELGLFAVCSCTGYATPGLDILLARDMGMSPNVQRLFVGHMGCYAALPGLGAVGRLRRGPGPPGAAALRRADQPAHPARRAPGRTSSRSSRTRSSPTPRPPSCSPLVDPAGYAVREVAARHRHRRPPTT